MTEIYREIENVTSEKDKQSCKENSSQESSEDDMREEYDIENLNPKKNIYINRKCE